VHLFAYDVDFLAPCNAHVTDVYDQDSGEALGYATTTVVAKRAKKLMEIKLMGLRMNLGHSQMLCLIDERFVSQSNNGTLKLGLQNPRTFIARFSFYFKIVGVGSGCGVP